MNVICESQPVPGANKDGRAQALLHRVLTSTAVVLSDASWRKSADSRHHVMTALCEMVETHPWRSGDHALLPSLSRMLMDPSCDATVWGAAIDLIRVVQGVLKTLHQGHLLEAPRLASDYPLLDMLSTQIETVDAVLAKVPTAKAPEPLAGVQGKLHAETITDDRLTVFSFSFDGRRRATSRTYPYPLYNTTRNQLS